MTIYVTEREARVNAQRLMNEASFLLSNKPLDERSMREFLTRETDHGLFHMVICFDSTVDKDRMDVLQQSAQRAHENVLDRVGSVAFKTLLGPSRDDQYGLIALNYELSTDVRTADAAGLATALRAIHTVVELTESSLIAQSIFDAVLEGEIAD